MSGAQLFVAAVLMAGTVVWMFVSKVGENEDMGRLSLGELQRMSVMFKAAAGLLVIGAAMAVIGR